MQRRSVLLGLAAAALPLPALANPPPRWHSINKRLVKPSLAYGPPAGPLTLPYREEAPHFARFALKLTGGPLGLIAIEYVYPLGGVETHVIGARLERQQIFILPPHRLRPSLIRIQSDAYADGHRYWQLVGTNDPV